MTYGISLVRCRPGRTVPETLADLAAGYDAEHPEDLPPLNLTGEQREAWGRIVRRISAELGSVSVEEYPTTLTLCRLGPYAFYQLDYDGGSAEIEIPYRYRGAEALPVVEEAYRAAMIVEEETGLEGFDAEVSQGVRGGDVHVAAARLGGISRWVSEHLARHGAAAGTSPPTGQDGP